MIKNSQKTEIPPIPWIADNPTNYVGYRDTLDRIAAIMQLMTELDLSKGLSDDAENGLFWIQIMLIDSVKYVSDALEQTDQEKQD